MKQQAEEQRSMQSQTPPARRDLDPVALVTLIGVIALLVITFTNMRDIDRLDRGLGERLGKLEGQMAQVGNRPANAAAPQQGLDPSRVYTVKTADAPVRGPAAAPVTIAEFSDFQCPFCQKVGPTVKQVEEVYKDKVRLVWKHMPLTSIHKNAMGAALAAEAARSQGKFWEFHDKLFANQSKLEVTDLKRYAQELGLDQARFEKDMVDLEKKKRVEDDMAEARALGVTGTPGFFVNGHFLNGAKPFDEFATVIDAELKRLNLPIPSKPAS